MKLTRAGLIILAAALLAGALIVGAATAVSSARGAPPPRAIQQPSAQGGGVVRLRPGADGGPVFQFGSAASNLFGLRTALGNLLIVGWVTLVGVVALRWARSRRRGRDDGSG